MLRFGLVYVFLTTLSTHDAGSCNLLFFLLFRKENIDIRMFLLKSLLLWWYCVWRYSLFHILFLKEPLYDEIGWYGYIYHSNNILFIFSDVIVASVQILYVLYFCLLSNVCNIFVLRMFFLKCVKNMRKRKIMRICWFVSLYSFNFPAYPLFLSIW